MKEDKYTEMPNCTSNNDTKFKSQPDIKDLTSQKRLHCEHLKRRGFRKDKSTGKNTHKRTKINNCRDSLILSSPCETSQQMHYLAMFLSVKLFVCQVFYTQCGAAKH